MPYGLKKRKNKNRVTGLILSIILVAGICSGCGGEYADVSGDRAVSGRAVSGSGISGQAVSGGAVKSAGKDPSKKYTCCNEQNLYYVENGTPILVENNRQSGEERRLCIKEISGICYVDADWLYYVTCSGDAAKNQDQIWRVPVRKERQWRVDESAAEMILERNRRDGWDLYWCNGSYIVYSEPKEGGSTLKLYNIRKKQYEPCDDLGSGFLYVEELFEESVIISCDRGLMEKKLGADTVNQIRDNEEDPPHYFLYI